MSITYTDSMAIVPPEVTREDLTDALGTALQFGPPAPWIIGDLLVALEERHGEEAMLASLPADARRGNVARRCLAVCQTFPPAVRRSALEFGHYRRVLKFMKKRKDFAEKALDLAEENDWTPAQLGLHLAGHDPDEPDVATMAEQLARLTGSREVKLWFDGYESWRVLEPVSGTGKGSISAAIKAAYRSHFEKAPDALTKVA
jgi:hypothetical protein